ncbi:hypothetical protein ACLOAV_010660 [Pseudogymnoascus australis]
MANINDDAEMATFFRMYKQYQSKNGSQQPPSQPAAGLQHPANRVQRTTPRQSPRRGLYPPIPPQNVSEASSDLQLQLEYISATVEYVKATVEDVKAKVEQLEDVKAKLEQIGVAFESLAQTTSEGIRTTLEGMGAAAEAMTRLEVIGRGVIGAALNAQPPSGSTSQPQSSNPQPVNQYSHHQPLSVNPQKTYQERSAAQPPPSFPSSNPSYVPSLQVPAPYSDPSYDFPSFEI